MTVLARCIRWATFFLAALAAASTASGQSAFPDVTVKYRFVEKRSVLDELHVGTEQPDFRFSVFGTFSVVFGPTTSDPWMGRTAKFTDVNAYFYNTLSAAPPRSLDSALNLSGLTGHQLPIAAPFDAYQFTGTTKSGSSVSLRANLIWPWFMLSGKTTLPAGQAVGVEYQINAVARMRPFADFNDDAIVDGLDLVRFANGFGVGPLPGDVTSAGDADGDGMVDGTDLLAWQRAIGEQAPSGLSQAASVPEPGGIVLALLGASALVRRRLR